MITLFKMAGCSLALLLGLTLTSLAQTTHTVEKGETLFSIAQQYGIEVEQLKQWNNIRADQLAVGQSLVIRRSTPEGEDAVTHTVQKKETLFSISKEYNVSIAEIKSWNNLGSNNLAVGQKLTIYPSDSSEPTQQSIVVENEAQQNTYYTVKSGDSLYKIAQAHEMTVDELKKLNDLTSNTIRVGQQLTVRSSGTDTTPSVERTTESSPQGKFVTYEVTGGTLTLQDILEKFSMEEVEFRALNPGVEDSRFRQGQQLTVLAPPTRTFKNPYLSNSNMQNLGNTPVSKYADSERVNPTTNGELYNPDALTAAHSNISLGSVIYVENPDNGKGVYVRINDRNSGNGLKLSAAAWQMLNFTGSSPTVTIYQNNE